MADKYWWRKPGNFLYKCRLCGQIDDSLGGGGPAINAITEVLLRGEFGNGQSARMVGQHACKSGALGVTDFVGMAPMREWNDTFATGSAKPEEPAP